MVYQSVNKEMGFSYNKGFPRSRMGGQWAGLMMKVKTKAYEEKLRNIISATDGMTDIQIDQSTN